MNSFDLRKKFVDFFKENNHETHQGASLIPKDVSVLFTTAGMQQFKEYYTHPDEASSQNIVTIQPCFRTSDIEAVGDDTHLTFFEMLGNFSFGGYFKKEAIQMADDFLTKDLQIEKQRISCSVFAGDDKNSADSESAKILDEMGLSYQQCSREDNFWGPTGDEGPCGPTVEFYIDEIEVWNLVFNEYYKNRDGQYEPLKTKGVDTGMGLERMVAILNNLDNVYETDVFQSIMKKIEEISAKKYQDNVKSFRIIADHLKAAVFALNEGILPSNVERGYVVRRLIRRAIVKGNQIGIRENFTVKIAQEVFAVYENAYSFGRENIIVELEKEEEKFRKTLKEGLKILQAKEELSGRDLFNLYQSWGLPLEISMEEAERLKIKVEAKALSAYQKLFESHQELSRTASAGMFKGGLAGSGEKETKFHTATHLLLASLRQVLKDDVYQKGSNITAERLRFDFNWPEKLTDEQIKNVEEWTNDKITQNLPVTMEEMPLKKALESGATSIPCHQYPKVVKVFSIGNVSREICGGPHVKNTGDLGTFKIIKEESSSAGTRRIKAILE